MMDAIMRFVAASALRRHKRNAAEYLADVDEWYRAGEGRPPRWRTESDGENTWQWNAGGEGHTYPACPHGMSLWTDYDNICGACEDGYSTYELALFEAYTAMAEYRRRSDAHAVIVERKHEFTEDAWKQISDWAFAPLGKYLTEQNEHALARITRMARFTSANTWPKPEPEPTFEAREAQAHYDDTWS